MKRLLTLLTVALLALAMMAGPAAAHSQHWDDIKAPPFEPHPHVLLIGVNLEAQTFARCVDLAAGQILPKANQHNQVHQGTAGDALIGGGNTNLVAPFTCDTLPL